MADKLFSFSIITYRKFDGVIETLDSLFIQDYPRIELIISDDGSENFHEEIVRIKEYISCKKSPCVEKVIISHLDNNSGTVKNVNNAISLANGYYFKALGGGDTLADPRVITKYVNFIEKNNCNLVFGKMIGIRPNGEKVKHLASSEEDYELLNRLNCDQLCNRLFKRNCLPAPAWCAKKQLFEINGLFDEDTRLIEDYPYWIKLCQNKEKIYFMNDVQIIYKLDGVSSSGSYGVAFMNDMFVIYDKYIFPYDRRFGILQPIYNKLKRLGLEAYMSKAKWSGYNRNEKAKAYFKYALFFLYIYLGNKKMELINRGD